MLSIVSFLLYLLFFFSACGYKPSAHNTPKTIGEKVYTEVDVSLSDPENSVLTRDILNKTLYTRLRSIVTTKAKADSTIKVAYNGIRFIPLQYNKNGYVVQYQANVSLHFTFIKAGHREEKNMIGRYEFPILPSAIISNDVRFQGIDKGSLKALDQFIAYISAKGLFLNGK